MAKSKPTYKPKPCQCGAMFTPTGARSKSCPKCLAKGAGRRVANKNRKAKRAAAREPRQQLGATLRTTVDSLIKAAESLGKEQVNGVLLKRTMTLREELIRSRHHNQQLRQELELANYGKEQRGRGGVE